MIIHDTDHQRPLQVAAWIPRDAGQSPEERIPFGKRGNHDGLFGPLDRSRDKASLRRTPISPEIFVASWNVHAVKRAISEIVLSASAFSIQ